MVERNVSDVLEETADTVVGKIIMLEMFEQ